MSVIRRVIGIAVALFFVAFSTLAPGAANAADTIAEATAQPTLLARAVGAGQLDPQTALIYRAYAITDDARLPARYAAARDEEDVFDLIADAAALAPHLSAQAKAQLRPFLVRPTDPDSYFAKSATSNTGCGGAWRSASNPRVHVWISCTSPVTTACELQSSLSKDCQAMGKVLTLMDSVWPQMTALMGLPKPDVPSANDDGNNGDLLDIYLVSPSKTVSRAGNSYSIGKMEARAISAVSGQPDPSRPHAQSGFILLRRDKLSSKTFKSNVVHEFFHILQYAHSAGADTTCPGGEFFFDEASATWAETYFANETAVSQVYRSRVPRFLKSAQGLLAMNDQHDYDSFLWPYFMQQTAGAQSIAAAYSAMEKANTCTDLVQALDAQVLFDRNFQTFALRNLNSKIFGGAQPINPRYNTLDPKFPDGIMPFSVKTALKANKKGTKPTEVGVELSPLSSRYHHYTVDKKVGQITFDFGALASNADVDINAVVRIGTTWSVRTWSGQTQVKICRDSDPIDEIYLVFVHHTPRLDDSMIMDSYSVLSLADACGCAAALVEQWQATFTFDYNVGKQGLIFDDNVTANIKRTGTFSIVLGNRSGDTTLVLWGAIDNKTTGSASVNDSLVIVPPRGDSRTNTVTGSSDKTTLWSSAELHINPQTCTAEYAAQTQTNSPDVTLTDSASGAVSLPQFGYGGSNVHNITVSPDSDGGFSGSRVVTALGDSTNPNDIDAFLFEEGEPAHYYYRLNNNSWGTTTVTWRFTPVPPKK